MALATEKSLFLHIPKTGGMFVRSVFKALGIEHWEIGDIHSHFPRENESGRLLSYHPLEYYKDKFIFAFVRHPLSWYQSRWTFRMKLGWKPTLHPLDFHCASNDFELFVRNALNYKPTGWVTEEYFTYLETMPWPINFVGRSENLVGDVIKALDLAGEQVDPVKITNLPRANESDLDGKSSRYWAPYTEDLAQKVVIAESQVISRYYHDYDTDLKDWCRMRPY